MATIARNYKVQLKNLSIANGTSAGVTEFKTNLDTEFNYCTGIALNAITDFTGDYFVSVVDNNGSIFDYTFQGSTIGLLKVSFTYLEPNEYFLPLKFPVYQGQNLKILVKTESNQVVSSNVDFYFRLEKLEPSLIPDVNRNEKISVTDYTLSSGTAAGISDIALEADINYNQVTGIFVPYRAFTGPSSVKFGLLDNQGIIIDPVPQRLFGATNNMGPSKKIYNVNFPIISGQGLKLRVVTDAALSADARVITHLKCSI